MNFTMIGKALPERVIPVSGNSTVRYSSIHPIGTKHICDRFICNGTISLPVGTDILWEIGPDDSLGSTGILEDEKFLFILGYFL